MTHIDDPLYRAMLEDDIIREVSPEAQQSRQAAHGIGAWLMAAVLIGACLAMLACVTLGGK